MDNLMMLAESSKGRAAFYEFFSVVFRTTPNEKFIGISSKFIPYFEAYAADTDNESMKAGADTLKQYIETETTYDQQRMLDALNKQYTGLFLLGMSSIPSSESAFISPSRLIKQEPWEQATAFYHIRKFRMPESFKEPEDHVSMELLFMQKMCELAAKMIEEQHGNVEEVFKEQKEFMDGHILKWVPSFCGMIIQKNTEPGMTLYQGAAQMLKGFLEEEEKMLNFLGEE